MALSAKSLVTYDRVRHQLDTPDLKHRCWARLIQLSHKALQPIGYIGTSRVHGLINKLMRPATDTVIVEDETRFRFPGTDYYWSRMLDAAWDYEPELDWLLKKSMSIPYVVLDLGANFGYWSSRVASNRYGPRLTVAVEPASYCMNILKQNCEGLANPVHLYKRAIDDASGRQLNLYGDRHAGLSIDNTWYGASNTVADQVETITIDDLVAEEKIDPATTPLFIKLDVEAVELRALKGATRTLAGQSIWYIEDAEKGEASPALHYLTQTAKCRLFNKEPDGLREITNLAEIKGMKEALGTRWQAHALNLFATASPLWLQHLSKLTKPAS